MAKHNHNPKNVTQLVICPLLTCVRVFRAGKISSMQMSHFKNRQCSICFCCCCFFFSQRHALLLIGFTIITRASKCSRKRYPGWTRESLAPLSAVTSSQFTVQKKIIFCAKRYRQFRFRLPG